MPSDRKPALLLLGSEGQLGREVARLGKLHGFSVSSQSHRMLDINDGKMLRRTLDQGFYDVVINAAAYTAVDRAETEEALAMEINRDGAACVAKACHDRRLPLIHISTDYVFDGMKGAPYREKDVVQPLNAYGRSKLAGEQAVREALADHVILRTSWVFGAAGSNFVKTMLRLGGERDELSIVADQFGCPTPAVALAAAVLAVAEQLGPETYGTYHCAGAERTSWYDFAHAIFIEQEALTGRAGPELHPIGTADYPTVAARPMDSTLDSSLFQAAFGRAPIDWHEGLRAVLIELLLGAR